MKTIATAIAALVLAVPAAFAQDDGPSEEVVTEIMAMLDEMQCEMDPDDIELEDDGGYDLDDVICQDIGQMDMKLDADLNEVSRRME